MGIVVNPFFHGKQLFHQDFFTDTDGTAVASHAPDLGGGYTEEQGSWDIQSNEGNCDGANSISSNFTFEPAEVGAKLEAEFSNSNAAAAQFHGLLINFVDNSNHWAAAINGVNFEIVENVADTYTTRATTGITLVPSEVHHVSVEREGDDIKAIFNRATELTYNSSIFATEKTVGVNGYRISSNTIRIDNLQAYL